MSEIEITQEDREAAAEYWRELGEPVRAFNTRKGGGLLGDGPLTHLIAKTRLAARERALDEAAEVVDAYDLEFLPWQPPAEWCEIIATAIRKLKEG